MGGGNRDRPTSVTKNIYLIDHSFLANVNSRSRSLCAIAVPSVCLSSVTLVHPTQPVEIFSNFFSPSGILAIHSHSLNILQRLSQGNPSVGGFKRKRGSDIYRFLTFGML